MCSICGMVDFKNKNRINPTLTKEMSESMRHRGIDADGLYCDDSVCFAHNRLAVMDIENGLQPMSVEHKGNLYTIVYNGEIYNLEELRSELSEQSVRLKTHCDTELVLYSYIIFGERCVEKLNGIFAFAVYDENCQTVFFARDRFGIKPLFFSTNGTTISFASEIKALLKSDSVSSKVDRVGLWQLIFLAPVRIQGSGIFKDIKEIKPAHCGTFDRDGLHLHRYWTLTPCHTETTARKAAADVREILCDAIRRQMISDVPLCTFLSGGLDSSVITAVAQQYCREQGQTLSTYSFEYESNKQNFQSSLFQPQGDDDYAVFLAEKLGTNHTILTAPTRIVADYLIPATYYRDFPGQADIDSSLLYFCENVKKNHTVALSGECSDEIFGGYPWFYRPQMLYRDFFPWIHEPMMRAQLFDEDIVQPQNGYEYLSQVYRNSLDECPLIEGESDEMKQSRVATWLSVNYFMTNLLERKDRMSMASSVEVRVPFGDHRILEYLYNIDWKIKFENGIEKALLRNAMKEFLPEQILNRKKSPYPKTHNPIYEQYVLQMLDESLNSPDSRLAAIINRKALETLLNSPDATWFGQLMAKPQLIAWLCQLDYWMKQYKVELTME